MQRIKQMRGRPRGVMVKAMDCGIVVSEFVLQSHYYVHFHSGGDRGVMVIVTGYGHGDTSSITGQD